jgi:hypothetical protein
MNERSREGASLRESANAGEGLSALPALARLAAATGLRTAEWAVRGWIGVGSRLAGAVSGDADDHGGAPESARAASGDPDGPPESRLRERGAELLRRSADVHFDDSEVHPAYARILDVLAPDEARILRLLAVNGPQPSVDVRTARPFGIGSELVAPGLSMIGAESGCRHTDRVPAYLNNLERLGLIWFSREPLKERARYQVLEAQPEVAKAMDEAGRARTVRRSIHLTPFGEDFCQVCLPLETAEMEALGDEGGPAGSEPEVSGG